MEQYVITNGEKYIKSNFNGKVTQTTNITMADVFDTKQQAMNFLKNSICKAWQRKYYVAEYGNGEVIQCTVPKPLKTVRSITDTVVEIGDCSLGISDWEARLDGMQDIFRDAAKRGNMLAQELSDIEARIVDWEHYIEFHKLNAMQGFKAYSALRKLFEKRRAIKNEQKLVSVINRNCNCSEGIDEILKALEGLKHQKYQPRALPELFMNGVEVVV